MHQCDVYSLRQTIHSGFLQRNKKNEDCGDYQTGGRKSGYEYYFSADRENEILLLEKWESKEHQQKHACKPHLSQLGKIKEKYGIISSVEEIG